MATLTAELRAADCASGFMRAGGARRALLSFLQHDGSAAGARAGTLRVVCFAGCSLSHLRHMLAPFGLALRPDGSGDGFTPAGLVLCAAAALGGPRPVLTVWKATAVERAVLAGVLKHHNGALGVFPLAVFKDVLWPWVRLAVRSASELDETAAPESSRKSSQSEMSLSEAGDGILQDVQPMHVDSDMSDVSDMSDGDGLSSSGEEDGDSGPDTSDDDDDSDDSGDSDGDDDDHGGQAGIGPLHPQLALQVQHDGDPLVQANQRQEDADSSGVRDEQGVNGDNAAFPEQHVPERFPPELP